MELFTMLQTMCRTAGGYRWFAACVDGKRYECMFPCSETAPTFEPLITVNLSREGGNTHGSLFPPLVLHGSPAWSPNSVKSSSGWIRVCASWGEGGAYTAAAPGQEQPNTMG